jgi:hypothetical protein
VHATQLGVCVCEVRPLWFARVATDTCLPRCAHAVGAAVGYLWAGRLGAVSRARGWGVARERRMPHECRK